jgi:4-amino-4-deoxy-L-arabinose transferase-like glycosyltransferase
MKKFWLKNESETPALALGPIGFRVAATGLALAGMVILWLATRWGIGLYPDSIVYLGAARAILAGDGLSFFNDVGQFAPVIQYPPLYSAIVAGFGRIGLDPLDGARWFSVLCYGANAILVAYIAYCSSASYIAALVASFLALSAFPMIYIHSQALTEPMFIFLIFLGTSFLSVYLRESQPGMLYWFSLCIGLSCLARYVGVAFIVTGAMAIFFLGKGGWAKRVGDTFKFSFLSSLPLAIWVLRNYLIAKNPVNRTFGFHPPALADFLPVTDTIGYWLIPSAMVDGAPRISRSFVGLVFLLLAWLATKAQLSQSKHLQLLLFCVGGYGLFLLISWSFNDQPLYLDTRTMALPYLALMIVAVCIIADRLRALGAPTKSWRRFSIHCLLILVTVVQLINGVAWLRHSYFNGIGFSSEIWRGSELLRFVKDAAAPLVVFSNAPDFIYTLTGKRGFMIPHKIDPDSRRPNQRFGAESAAMHEQLEKRNAVLIYFNDEDRLWYLPSISELEAKFPLQVIKQAKDGAIYRLNGHATAIAP